MFGTILGTKRAMAAILLAAIMLLPAPAPAQVQTVDPDAGIDSDLAPPTASQAASAPAVASPSNAAPAAPAGQAGTAAPALSTASAAPETVKGASATTWQKDDLIGAAEGIFGKGAQGLAEVIEDLLKKQGEPNGYIVGREGGGAFIFGIRYGSGTLYHKVEGQQPVYWRGPSVGFDAGANVGNTFVLVYNLYNTQDLFRNYGGGEGQAYLIGGFHVSYLRRDGVVLIPVRAGAGLRLGLNAGYMRFSRKQQWVPF